MPAEPERPAARGRVIGLALTAQQLVRGSAITGDLRSGAVYQAFAFTMDQALLERPQWRLARVWATRHADVVTYHATMLTTRPRDVTARKVRDVRFILEAEANARGWQRPRVYVIRRRMATESP